MAEEDRSYLAVVLDSTSHTRLVHWWKSEVEIPFLSEVLAHHMTLVFRPNESDLAQFPVGSKQTIKVVGWAADSKAQAVQVTTSLRTRNKIPHVTVSMPKGGVAAHSNDLLGREVTKASGPSLTGVLEYVRRNQKTSMIQSMGLRSKIEDLRVLTDSYKPGTIRNWKSGEMIKLASGDWASHGHDAHTPKAQKATANDLPDDPWRYFIKAPGAELVPVSKLKTIRARSSGIEHAATHMANAYNGEGDRRKPISVKKNDDGTYTVVDGNSTTAIALKNNWKMMPVVVEEGVKLLGMIWRLAEELLDEDFKPGTIRTWKAGTMIKLSTGDWAPYGGASKAQVPVQVKASQPHKMAGNVQGIQAHQAKGALPGDKTPEEHIKLANAFLKKHADNLSGSLERVQSVVVGDGTAVSGRVKDVDSAVGKLVRKPKYGTVEGLMDGTGMRIVCESVDDVLGSVAALKKRFKTSTKDEEDYISKPKDGYRSYHLIIQDDDGLWKEIQVRTPNQDTWANWCHDVYKPQTPEQSAAVEASKDEILAYGTKMSEFYFQKDQGKIPKDPPDCPPVVKTTFGCLPE